MANRTMLQVLGALGLGLVVTGCEILDPVADVLVDEAVEHLCDGQPKGVKAAMKDLLDLEVEIANLQKVVKTLQAGDVDKDAMMDDLYEVIYELKRKLAQLKSATETD